MDPLPSLPRTRHYHATPFDRLLVALAMLVLMVLALVGAVWVHQPLPRFAPLILGESLTTMLSALGVAYYLAYFALRERLVRALFLSAVYTSIAVFVVAWLLTLPTVFPHTVFQDHPQSAVWLFTFWHTGIAFFIMLYHLVFFGRGYYEMRKPRSTLALYVTLALGATLAAISIALWHWQSLPVVWRPNAAQHSLYMRSGVAEVVLAVNFIAFASMALYRKSRSIGDVWLTMLQAAVLLEAGLDIFSEGTYTVGWYVAHGVLALVSVLFLFVLMKVRYTGQVLDTIPVETTPLYDLFGI